VGEATRGSAASDRHHDPAGDHAGCRCRCQRAVSVRARYGVSGTQKAFRVLCHISPIVPPVASSPLRDKRHRAVMKFLLFATNHNDAYPLSFPHFAFHAGWHPSCVPHGLDHA